MTSIQQAGLFAQSAYRLECPADIDVIAAQALCYGDDTGMAYLLDGQIIIAIAGSSIPAHWLSNFKIVKKDAWGWLRAHKGFAECAEGMLDQCLDAIDCWQGRDITVTGHSRGAAVAVLLACAIERHCRRTGNLVKVRLVTFAQPRVSTATTLRAAFSGEYIRVVNGSDAVTRAPKLGYSHAGTLVYLDNDGGYKTDPSHMAMLKDRIFHWQHDRATDHRMSDYNRNLKRAGIQ